MAQDKTGADLDYSISALDTSTKAGEDAIVSLIEKWYKSDSEIRLRRAAIWQQNILFLAGDQWLQYNIDQNRWQTIPWTNANQSIDRPVSNYILVYVNSNISSFTGKPTTTIDENSDDPKDKTAAQVATVVKDYLWEENDKDDQYDEAALWGLATSVAFRKSCKVPTGKKIPIPIPPDNPMYEAAVKKQGTDKPVKMYALRKVHSEIISPFNLSFDNSGKRWKDIGVVMETQIRGLDWFKMNYGKDLSDQPGYTGKGDQVETSKSISNVINIGESLKDIIEGAQQQGQEDSAEHIADSNIVHEICVRPTMKHTRGRYIVVGGGKLLFDSAKGRMLEEDLDPDKPNKHKDMGSPYYYLDGKIWHCYTIWQYHRLPGSIYGISLIQQLVPKQRMINQIDALVAYNRKTIAVGKWLIPDKSGLGNGSMVGKPGQEVQYRPGSNGEKPELVQGVPVPVQVMEERNNHLADMDRIANSADIRSGINPKGVTTVGQLQILNENAQKSMSKPVDRWEKFIEESEKLDLLNFQSCYKVPDPAIFKELQKLSKDILNFDWEQFTGEELRDNVNVRVEKGSTIVKSRIVQQQVILDLAKAGLLPDVVTDPFQHKTLLSKFGLTDLLTESNIDVKKAEKVIEMMMEGIYPPVEDHDNPDIQLIVLTRYMKRPKFMETDDKIKLLFKRRFDEYVARLSQARAIPEDAPEPETAGAPSAGGKAGTQTA